VSLPEALEAVFFDVGGPVYPDDSFRDALLVSLDELRADRGEGPTDRELFTGTYDGIRAAQSGSLRTALADRFLDGRRDLLKERVRQHWVHPAGSMYDDVVPLFEALHGRVRVGLLANQEAGVVDALRRDGLGDLVDVWGISALVGHEKPSPELFGWALAEAGAAPDRAVHVGNRLDNDVRPARALGLATVWVLRGEAPDEPTEEQLSEPDLTVRDLTGLADVLLPRVRGSHG
jgi:FMN phosphatase YigB (HAD superfamily)